jgi:rsbT co-antagonist protein RsbR
MMQTRQQLINRGVMGLCTGLGVLLLAEYVRINETTVTIAAIIGVLISSILLISYWRGFDQARYIYVIFFATLIGLVLPTEAVHIHPMALVPAITALVMTGPLWVIVSAMVCYGLVMVRGNFQTRYTSPEELLYLVLIVGILILSRLATDNAQRLSEANARAEQERLRAEEALAKSQQQADALLEQNSEQQRLLQLVNDLEIPAISVAQGVLLAPIVGSIDAERAARLARNLLEAASAQRVRLVILDIAGATAVDTTVVQALLQTAQSLRLLGCQVTLTGIAPQVAMTLTKQRVTLGDISVARSPGEVLAHRAMMMA